MRLAHYQFETIHPFLDGNGRLGRLLAVFYLVQKDLLPQPLLYLNTYFSLTETTLRPTPSSQGAWKLQEWLSLFNRRGRAGHRCHRAC